jgi:nitrogen fixation protein
MRQHINIQSPKKPLNKSIYDVKEERNAGKAPLINLKNGNRVEVGWGFNEAMTGDRVFAIKIGDKEAYLYADEILRYLRWV